MTYGTRRPASAQYPTASVIALTLGLFGLVAAAVGLWIELAEGSFTLTLFAWTWKAADIADLWGPALLIGGGAVAIAGVAASLAAGGQRVAHGRVAALEGAIGALGIGAAIYGVWLLV